MNSTCRRFALALLACICVGLISWAQEGSRLFVPESADVVARPVGLMHVSMDVLVDGQALPTVQRGGKTYLAVPRWGTEYSLRIWNHGPRRIVAVLSVDGLSVMHGRPASESDPGYILAPHSQVVIKGWRRNMNTVAAFSFEPREKSYANLIGQPENIGVIGLVAFEEMPIVPRPFLDRRAGASSPAFRAAPEVGKTGTGYGRDIDSAVYYAPFVRSPNRRAITIYYGLELPEIPALTPTESGSEFAPPPPGDPRR